MSQVTLHDYLDRADRALSRIESALAKRRAENGDSGAVTVADDKLRSEVSAVLGELDSLIAKAEQ